MKTAASATFATPLIAEVRPGPAVDVIVDDRPKAPAFFAMTKPRLTMMVLVTVSVGFLLGVRGPVPLDRLLLTMIGTALVAGGASVWNQILERDRDSRMRRTRTRPLPSGRVGLGEAVAFGSALTVAGVAILALGVNALSAGVAATTFILYVGVYTPLKPITTLNTAVGAIPGALPPMIGWAASGNPQWLGAFALFLIVFLWQFPHFLAIAWIYRDDYARGGHKMLPGVDPDGSMTGRQAMWHALELLPAGLIPAIPAIGLGGPWYFAGALALGSFYLYFAVKFWLDVNDRTARKLLLSSFLYLPAILVLMLIDSPA